MNLIHYRLLLIFCIISSTAFAQTASFTASPTKGCVPLVVSFTNTSPVATGTTYKWDFGNGNTSTLRDPQTSYTDPRGYTVTLQVSNDGGTTYTAAPSQSIVAYKNPTALFTVDSRKGCTPFTANFTDKSTNGDGTINQWSWDFRTGTSSALQNPSCTYNSAGIYNVFLQVTDTHGCTSSKDSTNFMDIGDAPIVSFMPDPSSACKVPANVSFNNTTTGGGTLSYHWDFGDGGTSTETSPTHTFNSYGNPTVKLSVQSDYGCTRDLSDIFPIVKVTADGNIADGVRILSKTGDNACPGKVLTFTNTSTGTPYAAWDFGDNSGLDYNPNTIHTYTKGGTYTVILYASPDDNCVDKTTWTINIDVVSAQFTLSPENSCKSPQPIIITNTSVNASSYFWTFQDGSTSSDAVPSKTITLEADADEYVTHDIKGFSFILTAKSGNGCTSTLNKTVSIKRPTASFIVDTIQGCVPLKVLFTDHSKSDNDIASHRWEFGDGKDTTTTWTDVSAYHTFTTAGLFNTRLIITNDVGCKDTSFTINIKTGTLPHPNFSVSPNPACASDVVTITDLTPSADNVNSWYYSMNNQGIDACSSVGSPTFKIKPGIGAIKIQQIVSYNGCTAEKTVTNALYNNGPLSAFTYNLDCASPLIINFRGSSQGGNAYKWDFGDGTPAQTTLNITHTYTTAGNHTVKFISFNGSCSDTAIQVVHVRQKSAQFTTPTSACANQDIKFAGTGSLIQSDICGEKYIWTFNDSTPVIRTDADTVIHQFAHRGTYQVHMSALYDNGCSDTLSKAIRIYEPYAGFTTTPKTGCTPLNVTFVDTSKIDGNAIKTWDWYYDLGYPPVSKLFAGSTVSHNYTAPGQYTARLIVTDTRGCTGKAEQVISTASPNANFNYLVTNHLCAGDTISFKRTYPTVDNLTWNFGDGTTSTLLDNPLKHVYTVGGDFAVELNVSRYGCSADLKKATDYVKVQKPDAEFSLSGTSFNCYPTDPVIFTHLNPSANIIAGSWTPGENNIEWDYKYTDPPKTYRYSNPGTFNARLWVETSYYKETSSKNCLDTFKQAIIITGPMADIGISKPLACINDVIQLSVLNPANVVSFWWDLGDGSFDHTGISTINHPYTSVGKKNVILYLSNATCIDAPTSEAITIDEVIARFSVPDTIACSEKQIKFTNASTGQNSQTWTFGDGVTSNASNPSHNFAAGKYKVILDAVNTVSGCSSQASKNMTVNQTPAMTLKYDKSKCPENKALLIATGGESVSWSPTEGLTSNNTYSVIATPKISTQYYATVTSKYATSQCTNTDSMMVTRATVEIAPSRTSLPVGDTVQISLYKSADVLAYSWKPETGVSCTTCPNPVIRPYDSVYYMIVTEPANCFSDTIKIHFKLDVNDLSIIAPTSFKPGDPVNGTFRIVGKGVPGAKEFKLEIYNRWGNLVFSSNDASLGWDGLYNGHEQPIDTYVWIATLKLFDGSGQVKKGTVLLQH
jgi:gliding motility-associated-like protein